MPKLPKCQNIKTDNFSITDINILYEFQHSFDFFTSNNFFFFFSINLYVIKIFCNILFIVLFNNFTYYNKKVFY